MTSKDKSIADVLHPTVPIEYAGKWIAWDHTMTEVVASGSTPAEVLQAAKEAGEPNPVLGKSPPANVRMIGAGPLSFQRSKAAIRQQDFKPSSE